MRLLRPVAALTLAAVLLSTASPGTPDCKRDHCPAAMQLYTDDPVDVTTFITQFVPQSVHSKKTRAGRRKANIAAKQPTCGTLAILSSHGDWRACAPDSKRCNRIVKAIDNLTAVLHQTSAALKVSVVYVDAASDEASSTFVREAASFAYKMHGLARNLTVWYIPAMVATSEPYDVPTMFARVLVRSFEVPDAVAAASSDALLHFLSDRCAVDLPIQSDFPGRMVKAVQMGDLQAVSHLVDTGAPVNPTNAQGQPCINTNWEQQCFQPLHASIAAAHCDADLDIARVLLRGGADVNRRGADGQSLLHRVAWDWSNFPTDVASSRNPKNVVAAWLMNKSPIGLGQIDDLGQTVFHVAARYHHHWMLEHMLSHRKFRLAKGVVGLPDNSGNTVLHYAVGGAIWYRGISGAAAASPVASDSTRQAAWALDNPAKYDGYSICRQQLYDQEDRSSRMRHGLGTVGELSTIMSTCGFFGRMVSLLITTQNLPISAVNSRNHAGDTPLHIAALANDPVVVRLLISSGADVEVKNERGLVAAEIAAIHGSDEAALTLSKFRRSSASLLPSREHVWQTHARYADTPESTRTHDGGMAEQLLTALASGVRSAYHGGWDTGTADRPPDDGGAADLKSKLHCGVVRKAQISSKEFVEDMVALSRPALISPFSYAQLKQWRAFERWKRSHLLSTYGDLTLQVRRDQFNDSKRLSTMTMRSFVASWEEQSITRTDDIQRPGYVRDATTATYRLLRDLEWGRTQDIGNHEGPAAHEEWIAGIPFFNTSSLRAQSFEFNLGPPRSGSNMRFCGHHIDVLVFGERRWFLTPPRFATIRTGSVIDWFKQDYQNTSHRAEHGMIELIQRPGEMLYVPAGWGHAVINTANVVGYSLHFQMYGSRMGERQRWASVAAQHNGLLQSRHPTYVGLSQRLLGLKFSFGGVMECLHLALRDCARVHAQETNRCNGQLYRCQLQHVSVSVGRHTTVVQDELRQSAQGLRENHCAHGVFPRSRCLL